VGGGANPFTGKFDGWSRTITNLYIDGPSEAFVALFGYISEGAEIKDIGVVNSDVTGYCTVGTLVG
jgi:hypothetical protein